MPSRGLDQVTITGFDSIQPVTKVFKDMKGASRFGGRWAVNLLEFYQG